VNIKVDLPNPKFCAECPCVNLDTEEGESCNLDFWGFEYVYGRLGEKAAYYASGKHYIPRPGACIERFGE